MVRLRAVANGAPKGMQVHSPPCGASVVQVHSGHQQIAVRAQEGQSGHPPRPPQRLQRSLGKAVKELVVQQKPEAPHSAVELDRLREAAMCGAGCSFQLNVHRLCAVSLLGNQDVHRPDQDKKRRLGVRGGGP